MVFENLKEWKDIFVDKVSEKYSDIFKKDDEKENEYKKVLMVITSSRFTPGAVDYAARNNIILVAGDDLLRENN